MKSYKQILNEWAKHTNALHELSDDEMDVLHSVLIEMYQDIAAVCEKHNLCMMLIGGSCLGAVRHKGFIPWDDDLDIAMPRKDYNKMLELLKCGEMDENYEFRAPRCGKPSSSNFTKIYKKGTEMSGICKSHYPNEIYIDIFPLEYMPKSKLLRNIIGFFCNAIRLIANCVDGYKFRSKEYDNLIKNYPELVRREKMRRVIGCIFSFLPHQMWVDLFDFIVANDKESDLTGIPTGRKLYMGETLPSDVFYPVREAVFESVKVNIPNKVETYLSNLYGENYMELPPIEKRESHFVSTLKLS